MFDIESMIKAKDVDDAIRLLNEDEDRFIISGGTDVLINFRSGWYEDAKLISIHNLDELSYVKFDDDKNFCIGAKTSFTKIYEDEIANEYVPFLSHAAGQVGGPQIRNLGTIGGNICNGMTSADTATSLCVMNAILVLKSKDGIREVCINDFYTGPGKTVRDRAEILLEIKIKEEDYKNYHGDYIKYSMRNAMDIATIGTTTYLKLSDDKKTIEDIRIAYGVAGPTPMRAVKTEEKFKGKALSSDIVDEIAESVLDDVNPRDSWRASKILRIQLIQENTRRTFKEAIKRAGGKLDA